MSALSEPRRAMRRAAWLLAAVLLGGITATRSAQALTACTAADIVAQDPGCPASGTCTITKAFTVTDGCTLDFDSRNLVITGKLDVGPGTMTIHAGSLTVSPGGSLFGQGTGSTTPSSVGGMITIEVIGAFNVQKSGTLTGIIDVSGRMLAGTISVDAGDVITIAGRLDASQLTNVSAGTGGTVRLNSCADIVATSTSQILATGGYLSDGGGEVDLCADGKIDMEGTIDVSGSCGGDICVTSGADFKIAGASINAVVKSDGGSGGSIDACAGTSIQVLNQIDLSGSNSLTGSGGGCGGFACLQSNYGDVTISDKILAEGGGSDGGGGEVDVMAQANLNVQGSISTKAGGQGCGGTICLQGGIDMSTTQKIDASGGLGGGCVNLCTTRNLTMNGAVDVSSSTAGGCGGAISLNAGDNASGDLVLNNTLSSGAATCLNENCGTAGSADISGCNVTITAAGAMLSRGPDGGMQSVTAREQMTIAGTLNSTLNSGSGNGSDGENDLIYPSRKPPTLSGTILPAPVDQALDTCAAPDQPSCLDPCPTCGNGIVEYPETCDNNVGTPMSCDGCDIFCHLENCDDGNPLTVDTCSPTLGCLNLSPAAPCFLAPSPTLTPAQSPTPSPTVTRTPSQTPTPSATMPLCVGDCNGDGEVKINEVVLAVNVYLGSPISTCNEVDQNGDGLVMINEVVLAVNSYLLGPASCPRVSSP